MSAALLTAALEYARLNWLVLPCDPATKKPLVKHGLKDATSDPATIQSWWNRWPRAMIGVRTGPESGLAVLDLDLDDAKGLDGGKAFAEHLKATGTEVPATLSQRTPRGGRHLLFRYPKGETIRNSASKLAPGVDVRGDGGYIIVAPSMNGAGGRYQWEQEYFVLYDPPPGLFEPPAKPTNGHAEPAASASPERHSGRDDAYGRAALRGECDEIATAHEGRRNAQLFKSACRLFRLVNGGGLSEAEVRGSLHSAARACGLDDAEIVQTLDSAYTATRGESATPPPGITSNRAYGPAQGPQQPPPPPPPAAARLKLYRDFPAAMTKEWQVRDMLGLDEFSVFYGEPGSGKSCLIEDLHLSTAAQSDWHGRKNRPGLALYVALERAAVIERRALAFRKKTGHDDIPFALVRGPINFLDRVNTPGLILDAAHRAEDEFGERLTLLGIDTVSAALCGGDENSPKDMGAFVATVRAIQDGIHAHVAAVHHQPHDAARMRGHGCLLAAVDVTCEVTKNDGLRSATIRKANDGPEGEQVFFRIESVTIGEGEDGPTTAAFVVPVEPITGITGITKAEKKAKLPPGAKIALNALGDALVDLGKVPPASHHIPPNRPAATITQWRDYTTRRGISESDEPRVLNQAFARAKDKLLAEQFVAIWDPWVWIAQ